MLQVEQDVTSFHEIGESSPKGMMEAACKRFRKRNWYVIYLERKTMKFKRDCVEKMWEKSIREGC